jgi:hypothetical protein
MCNHVHHGYRMGRNNLSTAKRYHHLALLRGWGDVYSIRILGIQCGQQGHVSLFNAANTGRVVVLPCNWFLLWLRAYEIVLPSNLLPGCKREISNHEWSVHSAYHAESNVAGYCSWSLG